MEAIVYIAGIVTFLLGVAFFVGLKQLKSEIHPYKEKEDSPHIDTTQA